MKLHEWQKKHKEEESWIRPKPCLVCQKVIPAPYGRTTGDEWTCSATCERKKGKYPERKEIP